MRDDLLLYYDRELTYLRQMGQLFAAKYPKIASRLVLEADKCDDPHVERLIEAFAFLAARVHLKIDDEFPEITEALLSIVYPHLIRPIPSMSIVEFSLDLEQGKLSTGFDIPRDSVLYSKPVDGVPCKFRTCYDTTLWPLGVAHAEWQSPDRLPPAVKAGSAAGAVRLELRCGQDVEFPKLGMDRLRFFLSGESGFVHTLYELLCCNLMRIVVRDPTPGSRVKPVTIAPSCLRPVGFEADEGMVPYSPRSFIGYRLLQEFFSFPEKFFFIELTGLEEVWAAGFKANAELIFLFSRFEREGRHEALEAGVSVRTFRIGCTPVVNLFAQTAEPILLDQQKYEYPIVPDVRRPNAMEIFSVDEVASISHQKQEIVKFQPFYSFRHAAVAEKQETFWLANRRASGRPNDDGTDVYLSLVDLSLRPLHPKGDALTVRTTCTNRDLPARLPFGSEAGDFELENSAPVKKILALRKPTAPTRPPVGKAALWRLISALSLNYLSLVTEGKGALQQILKLYNFTDSGFSARMIEGISALRSRRQFAPMISENGISFAKGTHVEIEFDEEQFVGGGVYLFAAVLERFLGLYVSMNSFSQVTAVTQQRKEVLRAWPPRAGRKILM